MWQTNEQLSLLDRSAPSFDPGLCGVRRIPLDDTAWVDHLSGWVRGHAELYEALRRGMRWQAERRLMYDRMVDVPRLTASIPDDGAGHPILDDLAAALGRRYGVTFDRVGLALYRGGSDSVAWHRDRVIRELDESLVAIVSVGEPRRFLLRPHGGGPSSGFRLGWGDLLVMGGAVQRTWEHSVPKVRRAAPRISIMFRLNREYAAQYAGAPGELRSSTEAG